MAFENRLIKKMPAFESGLVETREEGVYEESDDVQDTSGESGGIFVDKHEPSPGIAMTSDSFVYKEIKESEIDNFVQFAIQAHQPVPSEKDYERGYFMRHFVKRYDGLPIEISQETWSDIGEILPKKIYKYTDLRWNLSSDKIDYAPFNLVKKGKSQKLLLKHLEVGQLDNDLEKINERYIKLANDRMPGLIDYFGGSYLDFTVDGASSIQGNLYTSGKEYYKPNGVEYIGYYHIHSSKGAMVGKTHTSKEHDKLTHKSELNSKGSRKSIAMPRPQNKSVSYLYESPSTPQQSDSGMGGGSSPAQSSGGSGGY